MAAPRTMAALVLLMIAGSCVADAATVTSTMQHQRKLLTTLSATTSWGSHHTGEKCIVDDVVGTLLQPVLHKLVLFVDARGTIVCAETVYLELAGQPLTLLLAPLPASCFRHTRSCSELVDISVCTRVEIEINSLLGTVGNLLKNVIHIKSVTGIFSDNGLGVSLLVHLDVALSNGVTRSCGSSNALGLKLALSIKVGVESLLGLFSRLCIFNGGICQADLIRVKAKVGL